MFSLPRMDALGEALRAEVQRAEPGPDSALSRQQRRDGGVFFTPPPLVEFVVAETISARLGGEVGWRADGSPELLLLDPAAGDGRFLAAAVDFLTRLAVAEGHPSERARGAIVARSVVGIERDPELAEIARATLGPGAVIHCREALLDPPLLPPVDLVVGNPPYQRSIHLARCDSALWQGLRGRYAATSHGEWDLYAAFLEQALEWLAPGGQVGLVVPSRWLTAAYAGRLRAKLGGAAAVRAIVDFGAEQIFAGATTYASVVFLTRAPAAAVAIARWSRRGWSCGAVDHATLGAKPWRLSVGRARRLLERVASEGPPLGEVARIAKGAGTNADPVFVLHASTPPRRGRKLVARSAALAEEVELEPGLLRPCLRGRDVVGFGAVDPHVQCLVPYDRSGKLIRPAELGARWPATARYLERCRDRLEARERGRFRGPEYYCFGRPQNLAFLGEARPKLVVPDVAREGRALRDERGAMALDSTYVMRLHRDGDYSLELLLALLNSRIVAIWLAENGILLRGNYLRMKTAYLSSLPLPPISRTTRAIEAMVAEPPIDRDQVDELVRRAYRVETADWCELQ